jgi:hypothetical protein
MQQKDSRQRLVIEPLRGMDERHRAQPNRASLIRDMTWNDDAWREAGGFAPVQVNRNAQTGEINNPFSNAQHRIQSLHWFSRHTGGRQYLVWDDQDGNLRQLVGSMTFPWANLVDTSGSEITQRRVIDAPWIGTQSSPFAGRLYLVNGYDQPIVFNGRFCDFAGFDNPAPLPDYTVVDRTEGTDPLLMKTTVLGLGIENEPTGSGSTTYRSGYRYKVTFVNERGQESPCSSATGGITNFVNPSSGRKNIIWVDLPVGGPSVVARRIYRTQSVFGADDHLLSRGMGENYYFLAEVQDNETTHYWDFKPDVSLGSVLDDAQLGVWPRSSRIIASFKNTTFLAGSTISGRVRYSAPSQPEVFPALNYFDLGDDIAGAVTAMYPTKNALVVFKNRGIYLIKGDPERGFFAQTLSRNVGCVSPNTLAEIPGQGVMFLDPTGQVHLLEGALTNTGNPTKTIRMSTPIPKQVARINTAALANARGVHNRIDQEYLLSVPTLGGIHPDLMLVYHYAIGEWSIREDIPVSACIETGDHRGYVIFGSHSTTSHSGLFVLNKGYPTKNGTALSTRYETVDLDLNSVYASVMPLSCSVYMTGYGNNDLKLNVIYNRAMSPYYRTGTTETGAANLVASMQRIEDETLPHLGVGAGDGAAIWGSSIWAEHRPVPVRFDISSHDDAPMTEMRVRMEPAQRRIELRSVLLEVSAVKQRSTVLLAENFGPSSR